MAEHIEVPAQYKPSMSLPLNFPIFYQAVIKERLTLKQYDAVNLLLLGKRYNECVEMQISQSMAANYISGKKKVSKDIITQLLECSPAECKRRLQALGLQNLDQGVYCLKYMLYNGEIQLNEYDRARLLHLVRTDKDFYNFLTEAFMLAIKCPPQDVRPLTDKEKTNLSSYQLSFIIGDIDEALTPEQIAESEKILEGAETDAKDVDTSSLRDGVDIFKPFNVAVHRTRLINLPQDYSIVPKFFYSLTGAEKDYKRDSWIAGIVRPYYEHAYLHAITVEEWCVLAGSSEFSQCIPKDDFSSLCILIEGTEGAMEGFNEDAFHRDSNFNGVEILYRIDECVAESNLRMTWVFLTGETR